MYIFISTKAVDADATDNISYRFLIEPNNEFAIDPVTGVISSKVALDYETTQLYSFSVTTTQGLTAANNQPNANFRAIVNIRVIVSCFTLLQISTLLMISVCEV